MRRCIASGINRTKLLDSLTIFSGAARIEGVHPLQFGFFRRKLRKQRRYGMPIVNPLLFYPWRAFDFLKVTSQWLRLVWRYRRIMARVVADPAASAIPTRRCSRIPAPARPITSSKSSPTRSRTPTARQCARRRAAAAE